MGRTTNGLIKSRVATAVVRAYRFVKEGAADGTAVEAVDAAASIIGVSSEIDTAIGERVSVQMTGNIAEIIAGGTVARGDVVTADAQGRAVTTTTTGARYGGTAEVSGVVGDIITVLVNPGVL
jgi:hypothetical protein